jgi:hypothetical protein
MMRLVCAGRNGGGRDDADPKGLDALCTSLQEPRQRANLRAWLLDVCRAALDPDHLLESASDGGRRTSLLGRRRLRRARLARRSFSLSVRSLQGLGGDSGNVGVGGGGDRSAAYRLDGSFAFSLRSFQAVASTVGGIGGGQFGDGAEPGGGGIGGANSGTRLHEIFLAEGGEGSIRHSGVEITAGARFEFFSGRVMRLQIWREDDGALFRELQGIARELMGHVGEACDLRYRALMEEPRGPELEALTCPCEGWQRLADNPFSPEPLDCMLSAAAAAMEARAPAAGAVTRRVRPVYKAG